MCVCLCVCLCDEGMRRKGKLTLTERGDDSVLLVQGERGGVVSVRDQ